MKPIITEEKLQGAKIFKNRLLECYMNCLNQSTNEYEKIALNYAISTINIHFDLLELDREMEVLKEAKNILT